MRKDCIKEQKERHGRKVLAVLPIQYPKELLTAMDVLAVELWGSSGVVRGVGAGRGWTCRIAHYTSCYAGESGSGHRITWPS